MSQGCYPRRSGGHPRQTERQTDRETDRQTDRRETRSDPAAKVQRYTGTGTPSFRCEAYAAATRGFVTRRRTRRAGDPYRGLSSIYGVAETRSPSTSVADVSPNRVPVFPGAQVLSAGDLAPKSRSSTATGLCETGAQGLTCDTSYVLGQTRGGQYANHDKYAQTWLDSTWSLWNARNCLRYDFFKTKERRPLLLDWAGVVREESSNNAHLVRWYLRESEYSTTSTRAALQQIALVEKGQEQSSRAEHGPNRHEARGRKHGHAANPVTRRATPRYPRPDG